MRQSHLPAASFPILLWLLSAAALPAQTLYTPYRFTTIAGLAGSRGSADGVGSAARFYMPEGVTVDSDGTLYVSDTSNDTIRKITRTVAAGATTWTVSTLAGSAGAAGAVDGTGAAAQFSSPAGIYLWGGMLYTYQGTTLERLVRAISLDGAVTTALDVSVNTNISGSQQNTSNASTGGSVVPNLQLVALTRAIPYAVDPNGLQFQGSGNPTDNSILEYAAYPITYDTNVTTWVLINVVMGGSSVQFGSADGPAGSSNANDVQGLALDSNDNVFFTDALNHQVRKVTHTVTNGVDSWHTTTLGGVALDSGSSDGIGAAARFNGPWGIAVDAHDNVYIADTANDTIRMGVPDTGPVAANGTAATALGQPVTVALSATDPFGDPITYAITATTGGTATLVGNQATFTPNAVGTGTVTFTASDGTVTSDPATIAITTILPQPQITLPATSQTVASGHTAVFNASAAGYPIPTYQWTLNGSATIPGAAATNDSILMIAGATSVDAGNYVCTATNTVGTATTSATLTVASTSTPGHLVNLSARADVLTGGDILIVGLGIAGGGSEPMLLRGDGPSVVNVAPSLAGQLLPNPQLTLFDTHSVSIVGDAGWGHAFTTGTSPANVSPVAATSAIFNTVGAFNFLSASSTDAAMAITAPSGNYTAELVDANGGAGIGLAEIYDAGPGTNARLVNLSARADVGAGGNILIGGFNIGGNTAETVLIRGDGPALGVAPFNLTGFLAQPSLSIYSGSTVIYSNTGWANDPVIAPTFDTVGAFHLGAASADCAMLVTLPPGGYTVEVSGANGTSGVALVEIYELY